MDPGIPGLRDSRTLDSASRLSLLHLLHVCSVIRGHLTILIFVHFYLLSAVDVFLEIGREAKGRRLAWERENFLNNYALFSGIDDGSFHDPADDDPELEAALLRNKREGEKNMDKVSYK